MHPNDIILHLFTNGHAIASATDVIDAAGLLLAERGTVRQLRDDAMVRMAKGDAPPADGCECQQWCGRLVDFPDGGHHVNCALAYEWKTACEWAADGRGVLRGTEVA